MINSNSSDSSINHISFRKGGRNKKRPPFFFAKTLPKKVGHIFQSTLSTLSTILINNLLTPNITVNSNLQKSTIVENSTINLQCRRFSACFRLEIRLHKIANAYLIAICNFVDFVDCVEAEICLLNSIGKSIPNSRYLEKIRNFAVVNSRQ